MDVPIQGSQSKQQVDSLAPLRSQNQRHLLETSALLCEYDDDPVPTLNLDLKESIHPIHRIGTTREVRLH